MSLKKIGKRTTPVSRMQDALKVQAKDYNTLVDAFNAVVPALGEANADTISEYTLGEGVTIEGVILKDNSMSLISTVTEKTDVVTLTATEIVGTAAGDIGHANGATLVAAPGAGKVLELVSAILIYDFDTAAYTGGGDDIVIQNGDGTVALTAAIAGADLLEAAGDKIIQVNALAATDQVLTANKPLTLKGTALTQPGTAAGVLRVHITYRIHTTGL